MEQDKLNEALKQLRLTDQALNALKLEQEEVKTQTKALSEGKVKLQESIDGMKADLDTASAARSKKLAELAKVTEEINVASAVLENVKRANDDANAAGVKSAREIQNNQNKIIADAEATLENLKTEKINLEKEISSVLDQATRLKDQIATSTARMADLKGILEDLNTKIASKQEELDGLENEVASKTTRLEGLNTAVTTQTDTLKDLQSEIIEKQAEVESLRVDIETQQAIDKENHEKNEGFLKMQAGLIEKRTELEQREEFLKSKYGDLDEQW